MMPPDRPMLDVVDLHTRFRTGDGVVRAVDGVSFSIHRGQTLALVGESGCGKSATALSIMRLIDPPGEIADGQIRLHSVDDNPPVDLRTLSERRLREIRGRRVGMVFQDPMTALNPVLPVGGQIAESIRAHRPVDRRRAWHDTIELLDDVGIAAPDRRARQYPHEWSGGMIQRALIAMAVAGRPDLLIADEPTTALDVTTQAQILELLQRLQREFGMAILFITHDLGIVADMADDVCVMYAGRIVERADVRTLFTQPAHPYTQALLAALAGFDRSPTRAEPIPGGVPHPLHLPDGCRFHPRCVLSRRLAADGRRETAVVPRDRESVIVLRNCIRPVDGRDIGGPSLRPVAAGHDVACWEANDGAAIGIARP
ncbi:MAG: ABC transporter ATP-binding protein [Phycisphaerales bacterium]|nr:ABC transporter ATP-binding protein [Phycisphaerales bacterium]